MRRTATALLALAALSDSTARAELPKFEIPRLGIFRKKKEDPPAPAKQPGTAQPETPAAEKPVNPSIDTLKNDRDEKDRTAAAAALRSADPRLDPDVLTTLMTSLQQDPSPAVRAAVAETIGKLKPISAEAGATLEGAVVSDPSESVRKAAQAALWQYHLNGYRSTAANAATPQTAEPPLAKPVPSRVPTPARVAPVTQTQPLPKPAPPAPRPISTGIGRGAIYPQTIEPPLAKPKPTVDVKPPMPSIEVPKLHVEPPAVEKQETRDPAQPAAIPTPPPATVVTIPPPPK